MSFSQPDSTAIVRNRNRMQVTAASLAGLLSVAIHTLLVIHCPTIRIGIADEAMMREDIPPFRLEQVRRYEPMPLPAELDRIRPVSPEIRTDLPEQIREIKTPVDEAALEPRAVPRDTFDVGVKAPVPEKGLDIEPIWEPRQEILAIEEKLAAKEIRSRPRTYVPELERVAGAADIVLAVDRTQVKLSGTPWKAMETGAPDGVGLQAVAMAHTTASVGPVEEILGQFLDGVREKARTAVHETRETISEFKPIENLLALEVRNSAPRREPDHSYFRVTIRRAGVEILPVLPKDAIFIQDCSSSISQQKLEFCKQGLRSALSLLGPKDRFNVVWFRRIAHKCFDSWVENTPRNVERARAFIAAMESKGKTDIYASIREILDFDLAENRPTIAILVTDGLPTAGIMNSSQIIEKFSNSNRGQLSVFTLGTEKAANEYLLDLLSFRNKGDSHIVKRGKWDIPDAVEDRMRGVSRPIITDLQFRFATVNRCEAYPKELTNLYLDRPLVIYGRCPKQDRRIVLQAFGRAGGVRYDMVFAIDLAESLSGGRDLPQKWAWQRIYHLIGEHTRTLDPATLREIEETAKTYRIKVPYAEELRARP